MQVPSLDSLGARRTGWIALLTVATIAGSVVFACATPFPALAALAALHMNRRDAFALTAVIWGTNQIIGYGLLHYPQTPDSFAWGIAIGAGAMIATALAAGAERAVRSYGSLAAMLASLAAAFVGYEIALRAATMVLPSHPDAFGWAVTLYVLQVNALAFAGLLALQFAGARIGLATPRHAAGPAATAA
jgi:uncharacterized membrane protein YjfL (UPF0719 family)